MKILNGSLDNVVFFTAFDITDLVTRETGLTTFTVWYQLGRGTAAAMTTPTVTELSAGNMPGEYSLLIDEALMTALSADKSEELVLHISQADMAIVTKHVEVYAKDTFDRFNS